MIPFAKPYRPSREKFCQYIDRIYDSAWLTNSGPLLNELEERLKLHLGVKHLILVANGSLALQIAYKALELKGSVITTPFSFVATVSTLVWEGFKPVFADINPLTFNLDPGNIESHISSETSAIVPVHVFGNPCEVELIEAVAEKYDLKVIYDAAHAFGVTYNGKSILTRGHISTLSLHATKLFHTIEGGAIITNDDMLAEKLRSIINFGLSGSDIISRIGINAKMNEFEAAMGLCVLDEIDFIFHERKKIWEYYKIALSGFVEFQKFNSNSKWNYSYAPVLFRTEEQLLKTIECLNNKQIFPKRYFYPSLDTLAYIENQQLCPVSRDIAKRILCLPLYADLTELETEQIVELIKDCCKD